MINLKKIVEKYTLNRIKKDCIRMHLMPPPVLHMNVMVTESDGSISTNQSFKCNSFVRNAYNGLIYGWLGTTNTSDTTYGAGNLGIKRVNTALTYNYFSGDGVANSNFGGLGYDTKGIVIGTGTSAESFEDYKLGTQILHGTSAGTMSHAEMVDHTPSYNGGTKTWTNTLVRIFNNNSGGSIVVGEIGLYAYNSGSIMICRDLLAPAVTVGDTAQLTVTYTVTQVLPY